MDVLVLLVQQDRMRLGEGVEGLEDRVEREWTLGAVKEEGLFSVFHELRLTGFDDPCRACIARFSDA